MEWRLFFPIPHQYHHQQNPTVPVPTGQIIASGNDEQNFSMTEIERNISLQAKYHEFLDTINQLIQHSSNESREDSYLVTSPHYGIKYRGAGSKLELKMRLNANEEFGVEKYCKVKLGKKELLKQADKILDQLSQSRIPVSVEQAKSVIERQQFVTLTKQRRNAVLPGNEELWIELCFLRINDGAGRPGLGQDWVSIAVEGETEVEIISALLDHPALGKAFAALRDIILLLGKESGFQPIVSGYPYWTQYIAGDDTAEQFEAATTPLRNIFTRKGWAL
jgi:hypothetical protein